MHSPEFYSRLCEKSGLDANIVNKTFSVLDETELTKLWDLFYEDTQNGKIPYFKGGFYPDGFYSAAQKISKSKNIPPERLFLYLYTAFAEKSHELHAQMQLSGDIFFHTFKRIAEYAEEYKKYNGTYGIYDYHFAANHIRGSIIRLGVFEYGYGSYNNKKSIYLHAPDGVDLSREKRFDSYRLARKYFGKYPIIGDSWLLYPEHKKILSPDSRILDFLDDFDIVSVVETMDYTELYHVFGRKADYSLPDTLDAHTSLQKAYIRRIKEKQPIGSAVGVLKY